MDKHINTIEMTNIVHFKKIIPKTICTGVTDFVINYQKNTDSYPSTNPLCWRGEPHLDKQFPEEYNRIILQNITLCLEEYHKTLIKPSIHSKNFKGAPNEINAWFNVNEYLGANIIHSHAPAYLSGVIYFQATGTGMIEFITQNKLYRSYHEDDMYNGTSHYHPEDGDMIIFPGYLAHSVEANKNKKPRVNMAFNVN